MATVESLEDGSATLDRDDLTDSETVEWLLEEAMTRKDVGGNPVFATTMLIQGGFGTGGNIFMSDVATALEYFCDIETPSQRYSRSMELRIERSTQ